MPRPSIVRRMAVCVFWICAVVPAAFAGIQSRIEGGQIDRLRDAPKSRELRLDRVPLIDGRMETVVLEPFDILAPNAVIEVWDASGKAKRIKPAEMKQFRGYVEGFPESLAYFSVIGDKTQGLVIIRERKFFAYTSKRAKAVFIEEISSADDFGLGNTYTCGVTGDQLEFKQSMLPKSLAMDVKSDAFSWPNSSSATMLNLAVQTDSSMYANFLNNATDVETFTRDLIGKLSTVYKRDLRTELRIVYLSIATSTDPWPTNPFAPSPNGTLDALLEYGDYWHNSAPSGASKSAALLLSGHYQGSPQSYSTGGIAWRDVICTPEFFCDPGVYPAPFANHYGGPYTYCGGLGINAADRTNPNPDANPDYGAPADGYWAIAQVAHELGHIVESRHTHCIAMSGGDQATYGRTYVDNCYNTEGGCFSGSTALPGEAGANGKGTIMSYCHLTFGGASIRYTFGQANEGAHTITDAMRLRLDGKTPSGVSGISAPASLATGASGTASVTGAGALTVDWTITNGTFTGGGTTATGTSVDFTANTNPVTLRMVATNASGCAFTDVASVTVTAVTVNPPTGVLAIGSQTGGSVTVMWTNSGTATSYNVYRSTDNVNFTKISTDGAVTSTPFIDGTAVAGLAYMYKVRGVNSGTESSDSNKDFAVPMSYTDSTITATTTSVKAAHFTQLMTAANTLRAMAGLGAISFTEGTPAASGVVRRTHVTELRSGIDLARTTLTFSAGSYPTDNTITAGTTTIKKAVVDEMRAALQ